MARFLVKPDPQHSLTNLPPILGLKRYGQAVWVSDCFENVEEVRRALVVFADKGIKGLLIEVHDPAEEDLDFEGRVRFADIETNRRWTLSDVSDVRETYKERFREHQEWLVSEVKAVGWSIVKHRTDQPIDRVVAEAYQTLSALHQVSRS